MPTLSGDLALWLIASTVNGMVWYRPTKAEIDQFETLGNPGWNWKTLEPVGQNWIKALHGCSQ